MQMFILCMAQNSSPNVITKDLFKKRNNVHLILGSTVVSYNKKNFVKLQNY